MLFSDDDLIAYLLGDAPDELTQRLHQRLPIDSDLLERLTSLRRLLGQINATNCIFEPPTDLVDTTLQRIDQAQVQPAPDASGPAGTDDPIQSPAIQKNEELAGQTNARDVPAAGKRWPVQLSHRSGVSTNLSGLAEQTRRRSLWDSTALTVSLTLLSCLVLPALVRIRFESRKAQCARNLELTGSELISYALNHPQGRFPRVALEGPQAFAGVYAIHLRQSGGQIPSSQLRCPSLPTSETSTNYTQLAIQDAAKDAQEHSSAANIASFSELHKLVGEELHVVQQAVGGDYAYNLGVSERGKPRAPKYEGRSQFAILADAPALRTAARPPVMARLEQFVAHEGRGINIFYEDGHVQFVTADSLRSLILSGVDVPDNPFENQLGAHELGVHPSDASLAPSNFPPMAR